MQRSKKTSDIPHFLHWTLFTYNRALIRGKEKEKKEILHCKFGYIVENNGQFIKSNLIFLKRIMHLFYTRKFFLLYKASTIAAWSTNSKSPAPSYFSLEPLEEQSSSSSKSSSTQQILSVSDLCLEQTQISASIYIWWVLK